MRAEPTPSGGGPLSEEHLRTLQESEAKFRKLGGALRYAGINGTTMLCFGALSLLTGLGSAAAMTIGAVLVGAGFLELRHRTALRHLDTSALPRLALNQVVVGIAASAYCAYQAFFPAESELVNQLTGAGGGDSGIDLDGIVQSVPEITFYAYLVVAVVVFLVQLLGAAYYMGKRRHLTRYLNESPAWVHDLQKRGLLKAA
ncbi:MAG: hypothetical protein ACOYN0_10740 [Phycisphaerales bacterium]